MWFLYNSLYNYDFVPEVSWIISVKPENSLKTSNLKSLND